MSHENAAKEMKKEIQRYLGELCIGPDRIEYTRQQFDVFQNVLDNATVDQLWTLYKFTLQGRRFKIITNGEYIGVAEGSMFIGIEKDGYAHS